MPTRVARLAGVATLLLSTLSACSAGPEPGRPASAAAAAPAQRIALPWLHLAYRADQGVTLNGQVPNANEHAAVLHRARALYGKSRVIDHVQAAAVANPAWLNADYLPDLSALREGQARLSDGRLEVDGIASTDAAQAALARALAELARHGLQVVNRVAVQPR